MKKIISFLLVAVLALSMLAGCGSGKTEQTDFEWTRQGSFEDGDGNYLIITLSEEPGYEGWAVTFVKDEGAEMLGWIIQQEGETLHGDLIVEGDESNEKYDSYIVTISEEGEDGLVMETEFGETYHFTPADIPDATVIVNINIEGFGQIAYAPEGEELEFDEDFPAQSAQLNLEGPETYQFAAKADEGWKFVKWTKDGEDYSTDAEITVELTEGQTEYIAVFEEE